MKNTLLFDNVNTHSNQTHYNYNSTFLNGQIKHHINTLCITVSQKEQKYFEEIIQFFQANNILSKQSINIIQKLTCSYPFFQYFILPIILDYKNNQQEKIINLLMENIIKGNFYGKKFDIYNINSKDIFDFFDIYISENFTEQELDNLYQSNYDTFVRMYYGYVNKGETKKSYLQEMMGFLPNYQRTQEKYGLTKEEQEIFGYIYRFNKFHILKKTNAVFQRVLLKNFIKKLPIYPGTVYRGITFSKTESYNKFPQNPTLSLEKDIQNFSTKPDTPRNFSRGKNSVFMEIPNSQAHYLGNILYDTENHAWFKSGTKFEIISMKEGNPTHLILKTLK